MNHDCIFQVEEGVSYTPTTEAAVILSVPMASLEVVAGLIMHPSRLYADQRTSIVGKKGNMTLVSSESMITNTATYST